MKRNIKLLAIKLGAAILLLLCILAGSTRTLAQDTVKILYDYSRHEFVSVPQHYFKSGTRVSLRFINVNPMFLQTHMQTTTYSTPDTNAYFRGLFTGPFAGATSSDKTGKQEAGRSDESASVTNPKSQAEKKGSARTKSTEPPAISPGEMKAIEGFVDSCRMQVAIIRQNRDSINNLLLLDSTIISLMYDPEIADSNAFKRRAGIPAANDIVDKAKGAKLLLSNAVARLQALILTFKLEHEKLIAGKVDLKSFISQLETGVQSVTASLEGDISLNMLRRIERARSNYLKMVGQEYGITSGYTVISGDEVTIRDSLVSNGRYLESFTISIRSYGDFKVGFSLGFAITFFDLNPTSYYLMRDTANKIDSIGHSRKNSIGNFSPIAFVHWMYRGKGALSPGISVGLNPDFSNFTNSRLLVGGSLAFTQTDNWYKRFMISAGVGFGMTDCLKPKYDGLKKEDFAGLQNISDTDLTEKAFRIGGFLSFTFKI